MGVWRWLRKTVSHQPRCCRGEAERPGRQKELVWLQAFGNQHLTSPINCSVSREILPSMCFFIFFFFSTGNFSHHQIVETLWVHTEYWGWPETLDSQCINPLGFREKTLTLGVSQFSLYYVIWAIWVTSECALITVFYLPMPHYLIASKEFWCIWFRWKSKLTASRVFSVSSLIP